MLHFLRLLTPRHGDALRPASALQRWSQPATPAFGEVVDENAQRGPIATHDVQASEPLAHPVGDDQDMQDQRAPAHRPASVPSTHAQARSATPPVEREPAQPVRVTATPPSRATPLEDTRHARPARIATRVEAPASTSAPLSPATVALHAAPATDQAPTIHVSIDRIDVRAPAVATAPRVPRPRTPPPTQSLADYLRGGKGRSA